MALGNLGVCRADEIAAQNTLYSMGKQFCQIMAAQPKPHLLPASLAPPPNSIQWYPRGNLVIPAVPAGVDQLVFSDRIPLGYDGMIVAVTNGWNGTGFVDASGDITWRIKKDRVFVPYYEAIDTTLGNLSIPIDNIGQAIPLLSGQLVQYYVNFAVGSGARLNGTGRTICGCKGYIWPRDRVN